MGRPGQRTILLVEDDRFLRKAAEAALRQAGFAVVTAADGEQALSVARAEAPDLILLDVIMPKLQGFEVLAALKHDARTAPIPVLMLSNLGQEQDVRRAMDGGAADYLIKANLSLQALVKRVQQGLAGGAG
ncbi:MAG: response regulator [Candidatus Rokubacteria bacterium]|nr:response regulator [Candidatus Rokubacteria bacterium]